MVERKSTVVVFGEIPGVRKADFMSIEPGDDSPARITLLLEHSRGTVEVVMHLVEGGDVVNYQPVEFRGISGSSDVLLTHSALASALSMHKWMEQHMDIFSEGLTSFA